MGATFTILNKSSAGAITGTFTNGTVIVTNLHRFTIDYAGGVGANDVVLTVTRPAVTINQAAGQNDPTNALPITYDVVFTEPVTGFDASDLVRTGTATGGTLNVTGSGANYTVTLTGAVTAGTVTLDVAADAAVDSHGNLTLASTSTDNTVTYDNAAPTVTINQDAGQSDPATIGPALLFKVVFSEVVTGFTAADVSLAGSTAPGPLVVAVSGSGTTYTVSVQNVIGPGTVVAAVVAGAAQDAVGNASLASTSTDNSVTVVGPAVTVVIPAANSHTGAVGTNIQATFDEALNPATVTDATFVVHGLQTGRLEAADGDGFGASGATVTVNPFADFHAGELVQVTATSGLHSAGGNPASRRVWQFRTAATGTGTGSFVSSPALTSHFTRSVALGDLDGDGDLDAFMGNFNNQDSVVWKNDGSGTFTSFQTLTGQLTSSVALGDVDGDGDLDAFMGNAFGQASRVWTNDGNGTFTLSQALTSHNTQSVALGDVDGDGDLDAFMGNFNEASRVWKNNSGTFTLSQTLPSSHLTRSVALGDVDGDGDLDAFMGNLSEASIVWMNGGGGTFTSFQSHSSGVATRSVALGDVDGDGDLDAFLGNGGGSRVWKNDGSGTFSNSQILPTSHNTFSMPLGDVDGDGDLDAFMGNDNQASVVWKNQDAVAPTADVTDVSPDPRTSAVASITIVFSGAVSGFDLADLTLTRDGGANLLTGSQTLNTADGVTWTLGNLAGVTAAAGSYQLTLTAAGSGILEDSLGNALASDAGESWLVDLTAPSVTINQTAGQADPTNVLPLTFDVVFSEVVTGFDVGDLIRTGTATGGTLNVSGSGTNYTVTLSGAVTAGTVSLTVAAGAAVDTVGNANTTSTSTDNTVTYDNLAPTADVTDVSPDPRTSAVGSITIVFSEAVSGFDLADLSLTRDAGANLLTGSQTLTDNGNGTWTLGNLAGLTAAAGSYQLTLTAAGSGITDLAGNILAGNVSDSWVMDVTVLTVTINQAPGQADPTNVSTVQFTVVFSEPVTGFDASDLSFTGSTAAGSLLAFVNGSGTTYTVIVSGMTGSGTVVAGVNAGAATNVANDLSLASTSSDNSVTFDNVAPTVTINQAVGQSDPTNVLPLTFTVVFSEPVTGFAAGGLIRTGTATGGTLNVSGSGTTYTVTLSGAVTPGTVTLAVAAGAAYDTAGNVSLASTSSDDTVTYDNGAPTVTINRAAGQADPTNAGPILFTVVFSEAVTDFDDPADIAFTDSTAPGSLAALITPINSTTYTVSVSGMTSSGTVVASVFAGAALDSASNASSASTGTDNTATYDNVAPAVTINQAATQADAAKVQPIHFTVIFSEAINAATFTDADVTLTGTAGGLAGATKLVSLVSGNIYNVAVSGVTGDGTVSASIAAGTVQDLAGNGNSASTSTDNTITVDTTAPTVDAINPASPNPTNASPVQFTVVFSEMVTGFDAGDVLFSGSTVLGSMQAAVSGSGTSYTVAVFGMTGSGTVVVSVLAAAASDEAGNASAASASVSVNFDNGAPTADVVDVTPDPRVTAVTTLAIVFGEVVNGFNLADLTLTRNGGGNLLTGSQTLTDNGNGTWTLGNLAALTSLTGNYQLTLTAAGSGITDLAGNALAAHASDSWTSDATAPTAEVVDVTPDPRKDAVNSISIVFSEAVNGFDLADLQLTRSGGGNLLPGGATLTDAGNGIWTLGNLGSLTAAAGSYQLTLTAAGSDIADAAGNALAGNASESWVVNLTQYAVGQGTGGTGIARVLYAVDNSEHFRVTPYAVPGQVRVAMADVNGDGTTDLITAPGTGQLGRVKVYNGLDGTLFAGTFGSFVPFAGWTRGLFVAAGDTNHDNSNAGRAEIFIGLDKGGGQVRVFNGATGTWALLKTILPFGGTYKGGVTVAAGDTDGNDGGVVELISGKLTGVTQVRIHEAVAGSLVRTFTAFSGLNRGVYLAAGDIDGNGRDEVFASLASGNLGLVRVLNPATGIEINSTLALGSSFTGGLRVGVADRDGDGRAEVLVGAGPSPTGGPRLKVLQGTTLAELDALFADDNPAFAGGLFLS